MKRIRYQKLLLFRVALILPSVAIARLGWTVVKQAQESNTRFRLDVSMPFHATSP